MIILSSPTKQMDFETALPDLPVIKEDSPVFLEEAEMLNRLLSSLAPEEIAVLMKVSSAIANNVVENIQLFESAETQRRAAIFTYSGTVFKALDPWALNAAELDYAQKHLRILSGMYGMLRPFDRIAAYRFEMKTPLGLPCGEKPLSFWKSRIATALSEEDVLAEPESAVINLASGEYINAVDKAVLNRRIINFQFKDKTDKGLRTIGMYSKVARGEMMRRIITEQVLDPESLKSCSTGGYEFDSGLSSADDWVFIR